MLHFLYRCGIHLHVKLYCIPTSCTAIVLLTSEIVPYPLLVPVRPSLTWKLYCIHFCTGISFSYTWNCFVSNSCTGTAFTYTYNCTVYTSCTYYTAISYKWNCTISTTKVCRFSNWKLVLQSELGPLRLAQLGYSNLHWLWLTRPCFYMWSCTVSTSCTGAAFTFTWNCTMLYFTFTIMVYLDISSFTS